MYLNVYTSHNETEHQLHHTYTNSILEIGDIVANNFNFGLTKTVDYFAFINAKTLVRFDNNLNTTTLLFKPKVIKKLLNIPTQPQEQDVINNITNEINNNFYPDGGELIEDQW